jgi:hypothetical protein
MRTVFVVVLERGVARVGHAVSLDCPVVEPRRGRDDA